MHVHHSLVKWVSEVESGHVEHLARWGQPCPSTSFHAFPLSHACTLIMHATFEVWKVLFSSVMKSFLWILVASSPQHE